MPTGSSGIPRASFAPRSESMKSEDIFIKNELVSMPTRREFLALTAAGALLKQSAGAQTTDPRGLYRDYARCLPDFLSDLAEAAYKLRNTEIARLTTSAAIRVRQQWVSETFWKLVGGMPERTPLNPR